MGASVAHLSLDMLLPQKPLKTSQAEVLQPRMSARSAEAGNSGNAKHRRSGFDFQFSDLTEVLHTAKVWNQFHEIGRFLPCESGIF